MKTSTVTPRGSAWLCKSLLRGRIYVPVSGRHSGCHAGEPRKRPVFWGVFCWVILWALLTTVPAFAREVPERDPRDGALDASLIVLVRQEEPEVFRIEEVFFGDKEAGATIRLAKFRLYTIQESGPEKIDTITPQTRILLFLEPKKEAPTTWEIAGYGYCFFWVHDPAKVAELRKMAQDMTILRNSWEKAETYPIVGNG